MWEVFQVTCCHQNISSCTACVCSMVGMIGISITCTPLFTILFLKLLLITNTRRKSTVTIRFFQGHDYKNPRNYQLIFLFLSSGYQRDFVFMEYYQILYLSLLFDIQGNWFTTIWFFHVQESCSNWQVSSTLCKVQTYYYHFFTIGISFYEWLQNLI